MAGFNFSFLEDFLAAQTGNQTAVWLIFPTVFFLDCVPAKMCESSISWEWVCLESRFQDMNPQTHMGAYTLLQDA